MFQSTFPFKDNKVLSSLIFSYLRQPIAPPANNCSVSVNGLEAVRKLPLFLLFIRLANFLMFSLVYSESSVLDKQTPSSPVDRRDSSSSSVLDSFCPWFILILSLTHSVLDSVLDPFCPLLILSLTHYVLESFYPWLILSLTPSVLDSVLDLFCPWLCPCLILSLTLTLFLIHSDLDSFYFPWFILSLSHSVFDLFCPWLLLSLTLSVLESFWPWIFLSLTHFVLD